MDDADIEKIVDRKMTKILAVVDRELSKRDEQINDLLQADMRDVGEFIGMWNTKYMIRINEIQDKYDKLDRTLMTMDFIGGQEYMKKLLHEMIVVCGGVGMMFTGVQKSMDRLQKKLRQMDERK